MPLAEVIEHHDIVPGVEQLFHADRADVAGTSGDENLHRATR